MENPPFKNKNNKKKNLLAFLHIVTFFQAIHTTNIAEEWVDHTHAQLKDEKACRVSATKTLAVAKMKIKDLDTKLTKADRKRKSAEATLTNAKKQAEDNIIVKDIFCVIG